MTATESAPTAHAHPPTRSRHWRVVRWSTRAVGALAVVLSLIFWPYTDAGYGPVFWLWTAGLFCWWFSFWGIVKHTPESAAARPRVHWPVLAALIGFALVQRLPYLEEWPHFIHRDEIMSLRYVNQLLGAKPPIGNIFSTMPWHNSPTMQLALVVPTVYWFGPSVFAARLSSALLSIGALIGVYMIALRMGGRRLALFSGLALLATWTFLDYSRTGTPNTQPPFFCALVVWLFVRALQDRRPSAAVLAGLLYGVALGSYAPIRILLPTFVLWGVFSTAVVPLARLLSGHHPLLDFLRPAPGAARSTALLFALFGVSCCFTFGPILRMENSRPEQHRFLSKPAEITLANEALFDRVKSTTKRESRLGVVAHQLFYRALPSLYKAKNGNLIAYGTVSDQPVFDPLTCVLLTLGLVLALSRLLNPTMPWLPLILLLTLLVGLAMTDRPTAVYRLCVILPAAALLVGLALDGSWRALAWLGVWLDRGGARLTRHPVGTLSHALPFLGIVALIGAMAFANFALLDKEYRSPMRRGDWTTALTRHQMATGRNHTYCMVIGTMRKKHVPGYEYLMWPGQFINMGNPQDWIPERIQQVVAHPALSILVRAELAAWIDVLRHHYPLGTVRPLANGLGEITAFAFELTAEQATTAYHAAPLGHGLLARYYDNDIFAGAPVLERVDPLPILISGPDCRRPTTESVLWQGELVSPVAAHYEFRLKLSREHHARAIATVGPLTLDKDGAMGALFCETPVPVEIRYSCRDAKDSTGFWLEWRPRGGGLFQLVPHHVLRPPSEQRLATP